MSAAKFYTDEDVYKAIAGALRQHGVDAVSTPEMGRSGESDESQLDWATNEQRVLVSFNVRDFVSLHTDRLQNGVHHAGIVVSQQRPIGDTLHRLLHLSLAVDADSMRDRLEFLGDW